MTEIGQDRHEIATAQQAQLVSVGRRLAMYLNAAAGSPGVEGERASTRIPFKELSRCLEVLANPNRLRLIHQLREPKATSEITLAPESPRKGENPERRISRQGVLLHLQKLASIQLVSTSKEPRGKALVEVHTVNYPRLFAILEELRALGLLRPVRPTEPQETIPAARSAAPTPVEFPQLLLVRGLHEGTVFPLTASNRSAQGTWVLGRKRGLAVSIDYDPFVSAENSEAFRTPEGGIAIRSLAGSRNGTSVNLALLPPSEERPLRHGDLVGVGRTLLLFREN